MLLKHTSDPLNNKSTITKAHAAGTSGSVLHLLVQLILWVTNHNSRVPFVWEI